MKYGRKPAVHNRRTFLRGLCLSRSLDTLGSPPNVSNDYTTAVGSNWQMFSNDRYGDCVEADTAHSLMLRTANVGAILVPTDEEVLALYSAVTGFDPNDAENTDKGTDETTMCQYLETQGFCGHKSSATGMIDPTNLDHIKWSVQLFGTCRLGIQVPAYAETQFNQGKVWDLDPSADQTIVGGHDVPIVGYSPGAFIVVTWGKLQAMTPAFLATFLDECHAEVYGDWIKAAGTAPSGFDLATLLADLTDIQE